MLKEQIQSDIKSMGWEFEDYTYKPVPDDGAYICVNPDTDRLAEISIIYGDDEDFDEIYLTDLEKYPDNMESSWDEFFDIIKEKLSGFSNPVYVDASIVQSFDIDNFDCFVEYDDDWWSAGIKVRTGIPVIISIWLDIRNMVKY